jgi:acetyl esterase/lipase
MSASPPPHVVEDLPHVLQLLSDGTVVRFDDYNTLPPPAVPPAQPVQWKDAVYDAAVGLKLRAYRPPAGLGKLPVLVYFHGGGYVLGTFAMPNFHAFCLRLAGELPAVVLSADYRLAPEHRLPAALDDAAAVMSWVRAQAAAGGEDGDPWLAESADFGRVFVAGDSAGGNIVHHVAVRLGTGELPSLDPARVAGHVMLCPLFGGVERTASEAEFPPGPFLTLPFYDQIWRLALPRGATRDHPYANPFGPESPAMGGVALPPTLVVAAGRDLLRDREAGYVSRLRAMGKPVELVEFEGQHHGFFVVEPAGEAASEVVRVVKRFVYGGDSADGNSS